jgi:hypothetical protein
MIDLNSNILLLTVFCVPVVSFTTSHKVRTTEAFEVNAADVPPGTIK